MQIRFLMTAATATSTAAVGKPHLPSDRSTETPYWKEDIPIPLEDNTKKLFVEYSKIPEDKLEQHLEEAVGFCSLLHQRPLTALPAQESMGLLSLPMHRPLAISQATAQEKQRV